MDDTLPSCWGHVSIAHTVECYESPPGNFNFDQLHIENDGDNIIMLTTDGWIMIVRKSVFYKKRGIPKTVFEKKIQKKSKKSFKNYQRLSAQLANCALAPCSRWKTAKLRRILKREIIIMAVIKLEE